jgi:dihydroneopterin aldolase
MKKSLTKLTLKNLEFFAYHGVNEIEKRNGGKFQVDVEIIYDATEAILTDDLAKALNYEEVLSIVNDIILGESFNLIETIAFEILGNIVEKFNFIEKIDIKVRKYNIPYKGILSFIEAEQSFEKKR